MRYIFISLLLLGCVSDLFGQKYYPETPIHRVTLNFPDHNIIFYTNPVKDNSLLLHDRYYHWFSANQIKITQGAYSGKLLNGDYTDFYKNKNLKEQGEFKRGLKFGNWKTWSENGLLKDNISWRYGLMNGPFYKYTEGKLKQSGRYRNGQLYGKFNLYINKDSVVSTYYKADSIVPKKQYVPKFILKMFKKKPDQTEENKIK